MTNRVAITGYSGFLGMEISNYFLKAGWQVVGTTRLPLPSFDHMANPSLRLVHWTLGLKTPVEILDCDLLIHLACDCIHNPPDDVYKSADMVGTNILYNDWFDFNRNKHNSFFVFMSSMSSNHNSANVYGRVKAACETLFTHERTIILKPGVVCQKGGTKGLFGNLKRIIRFRFVPVVPTKDIFWCVDLNEICYCIERIYKYSMPQELKQVGPMSLKQLFIYVSDYDNLTRPIFISVSKTFVLQVVEFLIFFNKKFRYIKERLLALT